MEELLKTLIQKIDRLTDMVTDMQRDINDMKRHGRDMLSDTVATCSDTVAVDTKNAARCRKYREKRKTSAPGPTPCRDMVAEKGGDLLLTKNLPLEDSSRLEIVAPATDWPRDYREQFWAAYPKKAEKLYALKCLEKVRRSGEVKFAAVLAGVARIDRRDPQFIKNPSTWLNRGCWTDGASGSDLDEDERAAMLKEFHEASRRARDVKIQGTDAATQKPAAGNVAELRPNGRVLRDEAQALGKQLAFPQSRPR